MTDASATTAAWEISPYLGVGPIRFGMSIEEVREAVGAQVTTFMKGGHLEALPTDAFDDLGFHVYYRRPGYCEFVEFWGPPGPHLGGTTFLRRPAGEVLAWLRSVDPEVQMENGGLTSYKLGIALYAPGSVDDPGAEIEGVAVFERGYYDGPEGS